MPGAPGFAPHQAPLIFFQADIPARHRTLPAPEQPAAADRHIEDFLQRQAAAAEVRGEAYRIWDGRIEQISRPGETWDLR